MRSFKTITLFCAAALAASALSPMALAQSAAPPATNPPATPERLSGSPQPNNPQPANPQPIGVWAGNPGQPAPRAPGDPREMEFNRARGHVDVVYRALEAKREKAAFLGVSGSPVVPALREQLKLPAGIGMVVDFVEPKSPADEAGIKQYDVLHKLDDQLLVNAHQLAVLVRTHKPGEGVTLTLIRQGESKPVKATLVEKEVAALDDKNPWGVPPGPWQNAAEADVLTYTETPLGGFRAAPQERVQMHWQDDQNTLLITSSGPGQRHLTARDKTGKTLFDGPINDESDLKRVPPDLREKLGKMDALPGAGLHSTTQPSFTPGFGPAGVIRIRVAPAGGPEHPQDIEIINRADK